MKLFKRIYIEITNVCNLTCSFCPPLKRDRDFMTVDNFNCIIQKISPFTDYVYLHVKGEPLMHKQLKEILDICKDNKIHANITTNGTKIEHVKEVLFSSEALRQINISLHSFEHVNEASLLELNQFLNQVIDAAKHFRDHTNTIVALRLWNLDKSNLSASAKERNQYVLNRLQEAFSLNIDMNEELGRNNGIKLSDRIYLNQDYEFVWPSLDSKLIGHKGYCYGLKTQLAILVDGTVVPCCLDGDGTINLGNIFTEDLATILDSERVVSIQNGFASRHVIEDLCKRCGYRERF